MYLRVKKLHEDAVIPSRANEGDAGIDLVAISLNKTDDYWEFGTGLAMEIPSHMVGLIFPRSSISKTHHSLRNSVGVIDSGYRGEVKLRMSVPDTDQCYNVGDRIGQLIVIDCPLVKILETEELDDSERGEGGFGSSGE
tara:strand:+ start:1238 stop:1654 length:417 start_codon:yes stop_codon:yes gene_type:complete